MGVWDLIYGWLVLALASGIIMTMPMARALKRYRRQRRQLGREPTELELSSPEEEPAKAPKPGEAEA